MSDLNHFFVSGRLAEAPKINYNLKDPMCTMRIGQSYPVKKDGEWTTGVEWHNIVAWGGLAETCAKYLVKGQSVTVQGRIQTRKYQDKAGVDRWITECVARDVIFGQPPRGQQGDAEPAPPPAQDDDLPF